MAEFVQELLPMLNAVWELLNAGELDQAWLTLEKLAATYPDAPEVPLMMGNAAMREEDFEHAIEYFDRAIELDPHWSIAYSSRAECLTELGRLDEANEDVRSALKYDPNNAQAHWIKAILRELRGSFRLAMYSYQRAASLAPDTYQVPVRLLRRDFDRAVREAIRRLPARFRKRMKDEGVEIYVKNLPDPEDLSESNLGPLILGAFCGCNFKDQPGADPLSAMPPRIYLYQRNIERVCRTKRDVIREIRITLLHEIGHYFGLEDEDLENLNLA